MSRGPMGDYDCSDVDDLTPRVEGIAELPPDSQALIAGEVAGTGAPMGKEKYMVSSSDEAGGGEVVSANQREWQSPRHDGELVYTVEDAVETLGFGLFQVIVTIFSGLLWIADAMELMLLSVLSPAVKCQWKLHSYEEALITSVVFMGALIGGLTWGVVCDKIGRKKGLLIIDVLVLVFGVLSAIPVSHDDGKIPGYPWLLICRFGVGFSSGGVGQAVTYYVEFLPRKARGICIVFLEVWWTFGSMFGAALALLVMESLGWHWYLGLAAIPLALVLPIFLVVPESARFLIVKGKREKAQMVIEKIAWLNCKPPLKGRLVTQEEKEELQANAETAASGPDTLQGVTWRRDHHGSVHLPVRRSNNDCSPSELESEVRAGLMTGEADQYLVSEAERSDKERSVVEDLLNSDIEIDTSERSLLTGDTEQSKDGEVKFFQGNWLHKTRNGVKSQLSVYINLFTKDMRKTTILLIFIWLGCAWLYYGIVLLTTTLLQYDPHCHIGTDHEHTNNSNASECSELTRDDYVKIVWTSAAELPGLLVTVLIIEFLGRKLTMASEFLAVGGSFLLLFICANLNVITFFLFLIRAFATGVFQVVYVYTPEVYPTEIRGAALGMYTGIARIGALVTPFVAQVLLHTSDYAAIGLYAGSAVLLAVVAVLLPIETKGRSLKDSAMNVH